MRMFCVLSMGAIALTAMPAWGNSLTYTKDIAPILNDNCVVCHRAGEIAPMSLTSYEEVRPWVKSIAKNVADRKMPPWHADPEVGTFANDRSLSNSDRDAILNWAEQGAPRGARADMPPAPKFQEGDWRLGEPDWIISFDEVKIDGTGPDQFRDLVKEHGLPEDQWIRAVEILPSDRSVVHHVIVFQDDGKGQSPTGWIGAWAAGADPITFPEGTGRMIRKGTKLVANMHYHPSGEDTTDTTRLGLYFMDKEEVSKELVNLWVMNVDFEIPPGAANYEVAASYTFPQDSEIISFTPHMHYRGKKFSYTATYPDGREELLMQTTNYDFNWQTYYELEETLFIPKGTRIDAVATYDNSADNPFNPDPTATLHFGDESYDEMMIGFMDYVVIDGIRPKPVDMLLTQLAKDMSEERPQAVYDSELVAGKHTIRIIVQLPREGDGALSMDLMGSLHTTPIRDIVWTDNAFESVAEIPGEGAIKLVGEISEPTGALTARAIFSNGFKFPVTGSRVQ